MFMFFILSKVQLAVFYPFLGGKNNLNFRFFIAVLYSNKKPVSRDVAELAYRALDGSVYRSFPIVINDFKSSFNNEVPVLMIFGDVLS